MLVVTAALCVGAVLLWVQTYRAPENIPIRFFAASITLLAVSSVLRNAPGGSLLPVLANNLLNVANAFIQLAFFVSIHLGRLGIRRIRWELLAAVLVCAMAIGAYLVAPADLRPVINNSLGYGDRTLVLVFGVAVTGYLTYAAGSFIYRIRRVLPTVARPVLRISLLIFAAGACLQVLGGSAQLFSTVLRYVAGPQVLSTDLRPVIGILVVLGFFSLVVGAIVPLVDGVFREIPQIRRQRRLNHTLEPLWRALHEEFPELSLELRSPGPGRTLYRRVVEIRDGLVLLSPHFDPSVAEQAERRSREVSEEPAERAVSVQAALVDDALRARRSGRAPAQRPVRLPHEDTAGDWRDDADALVRLARRFTPTSAPG